jgi:outer membrane immunogenic protein
MKKVLLTTAVLATVISFGTAHAADMAPRMYTKAPPMAAPVANWTGCYINGGGGYGMWDSNHGTAINGVQVTPNTDSAGRGWFGRVGGGCDYQFRAMSNWDVVIGAFGDFDFDHIHGIAADPGTTFACDENMSSQWSVGARAGILVTPSLLTYINGGYTQAHFDSIGISSVIIPGISGTVAAHDYPGWFIGGGTEYAVPFFPGLFWRNEYRLSEFNTQDVAVAFPAPVPFAITDRTDKTVQTIATELVFRFNFGGR